MTAHFVSFQPAQFAAKCCRPSNSKGNVMRPLNNLFGYYSTQVPSSVEDITEDWILHVMRQHGHTFGRRLSGVGLMKVEMDGISEAGNEAGGSDPIDRAVVKKELTSSNHILSEAFRVIVEVPDPPGSGFSEEDEEEEEEKVGKVFVDKISWVFHNSHF